MDKEAKKTKPVKKTTTSGTKKQRTKPKTSSAQRKTKSATHQGKQTNTKKRTTPKKNSEQMSRSVEVKPQTKKMEPQRQQKMESREEIKQVQKTKTTQNELIISKNCIVVILIAAVLITIFLAKTFGDSISKDITKSYLLENKIVQNELNSTNIEEMFQKEQSFVFLTSLNNEEEYQLEKKLHKLIEENDLKENFYIFDVNKNNSVDLNTTFKLEGRQLKIPTILYYKNGVLVDTVTREDEKMIESGDFLKLLDSYELTK